MSNKKKIRMLSNLLNLKTNRWRNRMINKSKKPRMNHLVNTSLKSKTAIKLKTLTLRSKNKSKTKKALVAIKVMIKIRTKSRLKKS